MAAPSPRHQELARRYKDALERGDYNIMGEIQGLAIGDHELEQLLTEVHRAWYAQAMAAFTPPTSDSSEPLKG